MSSLENELERDGGGVLQLRGEICCCVMLRLMGDACRFFFTGAFAEYVERVECIVETVCDVMGVMCQRYCLPKKGGGRGFDFDAM